MTTEEIVERARVAMHVHGGYPPRTWSTGERSAVALLTRAGVTLSAMNMSPAQATMLLADDLETSPQGANEWVRQTRERLAAEFPTLA